MAKNVLVVDDSQTIRQMIAFTLKSIHCTVVDAVDGVEGLQKAKLTNFDLVLTDQNMPKMTGIEFIAELRKLSQYKTVPVLMLTTESSTAVKDQGRSAGATGWIVKPFDPQKLIEVVNKVLK